MRDDTVRGVYILVAGLLLGSTSGCGQSARVEQPIQYKHNLHVSELEIPCTDCHVGAEAADHATIPTNEICLDCHEEAQGDTEEEAKLVEMLGSEIAIPWVRVTRVAEHVHFSHRRHVVAGKILCETCHGQVAELDHPVSTPAINFRRETGMQRCISCHRLSGNPRATVDCALCHR